MQVYNYIARNAEGQRVSGVVDGNNYQAVLSELRSRKLTPVTIEKKSGAGEHGGQGVKVSTRWLSVFYRQLSDLLKSGVPILRALQLLGRSKANRKLSEVVSKIARNVEDGESLADSMAQHGRTFPSVHIAMVRAGESGGFLEEVLKRLAIYLRQQSEMRSTVISTLVYPCVLVFVGSIIVGIVMFVFVPKFKPMFEGIDLPLPSRIVLALSDLLTNHSMLVVLGLAGLGCAAWGLLNNLKVRQEVGRYLLRMWVIGPLLANMAVARFCRILGTLLVNGIPILQAMVISRDALGQYDMIQAVEKARLSVQTGETLAKPLEDSGMFDEDVVEIIRIGEEAGNLDEVLVSIAETIEERVQRLLTTAVRLLEPMVLLALGMSLLFIILALVVPLVLLSSSV